MLHKVGKIISRNINVENERCGMEGNGESLNENKTG